MSNYFIFIGMVITDADWCFSTSASIISCYFNGTPFFGVFSSLDFHLCGRATIWTFIHYSEPLFLILLYYTLWENTIGKLHKDLRKKIIEIVYFAEIPAHRVVNGRPLYHSCRKMSIGKLHKFIFVHVAQRKKSSLRTRTRQNDFILFAVVVENAFSLFIDKLKTCSIGVVPYCRLNYLH